MGGARGRWRRLPRATRDGEARPNSCFAGAKRRSNVLELPSELRTLPSLLSAACFPVKAIHNINSSQRATLSAHTVAGDALRRADSTARPPVRRPLAKGDKNFWCRGGLVGRGFEVSRGDGWAARSRPSALYNPGPPFPVRKTDLRVARLRLTTSEIARKASPRAKSVLVKPNFESLNRAVFVQERSVATRAALLDAAISLPSRARSAFASRARTAVRPRRCSRSRARKAFVAAAVLARQRRLCRMAAVDRPISSRGWKELGQRAKAAADADKVSQFVVGDYAAGRLVSHPHGVR